MQDYKRDARYPNARMNCNVVAREWPIPHDHNYWEFFGVTKGTLRHTINGHVFEIGANDCCLIRPEDVHMLESTNPNSSYFNIMFLDETFKEVCANYSPEIYDIIKKDSVCNFTTSITTINELMGYIFYLNQEEETATKTLAENTIFSIIISKYIKHHHVLASNHPMWLINLLESLDKEESMNWSVQDIVDRSGFSHSQLNRLFRKYLSTSIVGYLRSFKMGYASDMLIQTSDSVSEIARFLGYDNISHFNHVFKDYYGVSPLEYRKNEKARTQQKKVE